MIKNDVKELQKILDYDLKHSTYSQLNEIYKENLSYFAKKQIELNKIDAGRYFHIFTHMRHNIQKEIDLYQDLLFLLKIDSFIYDDRKRSEERIRLEILEKNHKEYFSINHNNPTLGIKQIYDDFYGNIGNPLPPLYSIAHDSHKEEKEVIVTKMKLSGYLDENGNLKIDNEDN